MSRWSVAQVANLPYRRLLIGEGLEFRTASGLATRDIADGLLGGARTVWRVDQTFARRSARI